MNLLILSPDYSKRTNWGHQHVRDSLLARVQLSEQYGEGCTYSGTTHIPDICKGMRPIMGYPEVILMENWKNMSKYTGGGEVDCFKAFIVCDYYPDSRGNFARYNKLLVDNKIDLAICNTPDVRNHIEDQKFIGELPHTLKAVWVPQGVQTDIYMERKVEKKYDLMAVFGLVNSIYPERPKVQKLIMEYPGVTSLIGDWKSNIRHYDYARAINESRIFVCANGVNNQVLMKYFEVMASGTLLLTNLPRNFYEYGFVPGEHFAVWRGLEDLRRKIYYYLNQPEIRKRIASNGMKFVRENYSTDDIAKQILRTISLELSSNKRRDNNVLCRKREGLCGPPSNAP